MQAPLVSLATLLLLLCTACGGQASPTESVDAGYSALNSGDYGSALASFQEALAGMAPSDEGYLSANLGYIQAQCHIDAAQAKADLLSMSKDSGVRASDYSMVVTEIISAATAQASSDSDAANVTIGEAVAILQAGKDDFPDYDKWDALLKKTGDKAASLGSADALEALKGLGYVGGD